jgi:hypothetical protein
MLKRHPMDKVISITRKDTRPMYAKAMILVAVGLSLPELSLSRSAA